MEYITREEQKVFWEKRTESRRLLDERYKRFPLHKKLEFWQKKMQAHDLMRKASHAVK